MSDPKTTFSPIRGKSDLEKFYNVKGWCDALDYAGVWRLGRIRRADDNYVLVNFDGWSDKWKQWYCKHSSAIAPLRTYSCGYTGQSKVTLRDYELQISIIQTAERKLKLLLDDDKLSGFDAFRLASFVRGDLFVLVDSILTLNDRIEAQECHQISSFLKFYVTMALKWMNVSIHTYQTMRKEIGEANTGYLEEVKEQKLHVNSKAASLYMCGYEIFLSLKSIFGFEKRCTALYEKNNLTINTKDIIAHFLSNQGLSKLIELLNYEDKEIPNGRIDFFIIWPLLYSVPFFFGKVPVDSWAKPLLKFIEALYLRLKKEFEYDPQTKAKLEKTPDFLEFLSALERINARVSENEFPLGDLFQFMDMENGDEDHILSESPDMHKVFGSDLAQDARFSFQKQFRDSFLIPGEASLEKIVSKSEDSIQKEASIVKSPEVDELKQQLQALQAQMAGFQKTMTEVSKAQNDLKKNLNKEIEESRAVKAEVPKEVESPAPFKDEYLEVFRQSGLSPQEFEGCLGYVKQVNQFLHTEEKGGQKLLSESPLKSNGKLKEDLYEDVSLGGSEDELKILTAIELYISNNRLVDAMKLIKWRKKIIKLAEMNGWDVASIIAKRTLSKLDVDATDIIMSNLCLMQKMENIVGFGNTGFSDDEEAANEVAI